MLSAPKKASQRNPSTQEEHAGALNTFMIFFGDVMNDEAITRLASVARLQDCMRQ